MTEPTALRPITPEPEPGVVDELRRLLDEAEAGNITGVVIFARHAGGETTHSHVGLLDRTDVIAGCEVLKHTMLHAMFGAVDRED